MKTRQMQMIFAVPMLAGLMLAAPNAIAAPAKMNMPMAKGDPIPTSKQSAPAQATAEKAATVHVDGSWVRAAPPGAMMMAAYMRVRNDGKKPLTFVSVHSAAFGMVELHKTTIEHGISSMRPAGKQIIAPGGSLTLEPGGYHLMLMQPTRALKFGDKVAFRLDFSDGTSADVVAPVTAEPPAN